MAPLIFGSRVRRCILDAARRHPGARESIADSLFQAFAFPRSETLRIWSAAVRVLNFPLKEI